jgi:hypothetical protein
MKSIKIYGERNTNTNYLGELIKLNLDAKLIPGVVPRKMREIQTRLPAKNLLRDVYFFATFHKNLGWKHSKAKDAEVLRKSPLLKESSVCFVTISKNPYSWLLSLHKRPYHQKYSVKPDFETFLQLPWMTVRRENVRGHIANPIDLWNIKNRSYLQLGKINAINLTTENIFEDAEGVIRQIGENFGIKHRAINFVNFDQSTKYESNGSDYYRDYYLKEKWKESLSKEALSIINRYVDKDLMAHFGYQQLE